MPNYSHGTAGVAQLAVAGRQLGRPDLVELARLGAEQVVAGADTSGEGFRAASADSCRRGLRRLLLRLVPRSDRHREPVRRARAGRGGGGRRSDPERVAGRGCPQPVVQRDPRPAVPRVLGQRRPVLRHGRGPRRVLDRFQATGAAEDIIFADRLATAIVQRSEPSPTEPTTGTGASTTPARPALPRSWRRLDAGSGRHRGGALPLRPGAGAGRQRPATGLPRRLVDGTGRTAATF